MPTALSELERIKADSRHLRGTLAAGLIDTVTGAIVTPAQWLAFDAIARDYANGTLRITTRQTFQWHGVIKRELKATIAAINASLVDTIGADSTGLADATTVRLTSHPPTQSNRPRTPTRTRGR